MLLLRKECLTGAPSLNDIAVAPQDPNAPNDFHYKKRFQFGGSSQKELKELPAQDTYSSDKKNYKERYILLRRDGDLIRPFKFNDTFYMVTFSHLRAIERGRVFAERSTDINDKNFVVVRRYDESNKIHDICYLNRLMIPKSDKGEES